MQTAIRIFGLLMMVAAFGCTAATQDEVDRAPSLKEDGADVFDTDCKVHLRSAEKVESSCESGCGYTWKLTVDVDPSLLTEGGVPQILYYNSSSQSWRSRSLEPGSQERGFQAFSTLLGSDLVADEFTSNSTVYFVPLIRTEHRTFDRNGLSPNWGYMLSAANQWQLDNSSLCGTNTAKCQAGSLHPDGVIAGDQNWDRCEVVLDQMTVVKEGATLRIAPGAQIKADRNGRLVVEGSLVAVGTANAPITFASKQRHWSSSTDWGSQEWFESWPGIELRGKANTISHVQVKSAQTALAVKAGAQAALSDTMLEGFAFDGGWTYGYDEVLLQHVENYSRYGLLVDGADVTVDRSLIQGFNYGISTTNALSLTIRDSIIRGNVNGIASGDALARDRQCADGSAIDRRTVGDRVDPIIEWSDIAYNVDIGARLSNGGHLEISHCNIVGNGEEGIVFSAGLSESSFVSNNNIFGNNLRLARNNELQVATTTSSAGRLDIRSNFWGDVPTVRWGEVGGYHTGPYGTVQEECLGPQVDASGYASERLPAGPRPGLTAEILPYAVKQSLGFYADLIRHPVGQNGAYYVRIPETGTIDTVTLHIDAWPFDEKAYVNLFSPSTRGSVRLQGTYGKPFTAKLSDFAGEQMRGDWRLASYDPTSPALGFYSVLNGWGLQVSTR